MTYLKKQPQTSHIHTYTKCTIYIFVFSSYAIIMSLEFESEKLI